MPLAPRYSHCGKWERHRQGQARLWMGVGAICGLWFYFGQCLLGERLDKKECESMRWPCGLGSRPDTHTAQRTCMRCQTFRTHPVSNSHIHFTSIQHSHTPPVHGTHATRCRDHPLRCLTLTPRPNQHSSHTPRRAHPSLQGYLAHKKQPPPIVGPP